MARKSKKMELFEEDDLPMIDDGDCGDDTDTGDESPKPRKKREKPKFWHRGDGNLAQATMFPSGSSTFGDAKMVSPVNDVYRATEDLITPLNSVNSDGECAAEFIFKAKDIISFVQQLPATVRSSLSAFYHRYRDHEKRMQASCKSLRYNWQLVLFSGRTALMVDCSKTDCASSKSIEAAFSPEKTTSAKSSKPKKK